MKRERESENESVSVSDDALFFVNKCCVEWKHDRTRKKICDTMSLPAFLHSEVR